MVAALVRLRRDVADDHAPGAAREAAVGHEPDALPEPLADEGARGGEHLRHAGRAAGTEVAQHHHVARLDPAREDRGERRLFVLEHAGRARHRRLLEPGDLGDRPLRREVPLEDGEVALGVQRARARADDVLVRARDGRHVGEGLGDGSPGDRHAVAVQQPGLEQELHHLRDAARAVQVHREVPPGRLEVAQHRHLPPDPLEVVDRPRHAGGVRDGEEVQHGVGRASDGHDHGDRVLDRLARHDVARLQVCLHRLDEHPRGLARRRDLLLVRVRHRRGVRQAHPERLERGAHRVGGVHAAARAGPGNGTPLESRRSPLRTCARR